MYSALTQKFQKLGRRILEVLMQKWDVWCESAKFRQFPFLPSLKTTITNSLSEKYNLKLWCPL